MAKERFDYSSFRPAGLKVVEQANAIIGQYRAQGLTLTVRQLYYRFVAAGLIENTQRSYKNLASIIDLGRKRGKIDWSAIEDRTRNVERPAAWDSVEQIVAAIAEQYKEDPWAEQTSKVEVWVEKEALVGVVEQACRDLRVPFLACRGYLSQSEAYAAGKRFAKAKEDGYQPVIFHLGDHDPSGIDMTRDNAKRVREFSRGAVEVVRLGLNMDQIDQYDPPPNPAKETDSRFEGYRDAYGDESWELDALEPAVLIELIQTAVRGRIDFTKWDAHMEQEAEKREALSEASDHWSGVERYLKYRDHNLPYNDEADAMTVDDAIEELEAAGE